MEFFNKAKVVRLRSHLNKFLVADDDEHTVRQSRNGSWDKARWTVEMVEGKSHVIRLKSCSSGKYLTPSTEAFLTGMTGKKVVQDVMANKRDTSVEWEPIKEGELVKLRAKGGKFLRGNGGTPPWRNSVTHDVPQRTATQDWVLWGVDVVVIVVSESEELVESNLSPMSSYPSMPDIDRVKNQSCGSPDSYHSAPRDSMDIERVKNQSYGSSDSYHGSPRDSVDIERVKNQSYGSPDSYRDSPRASGRQSGMDFFIGAKAVRLQSYHNKYLVADEDQETVRQSRNGSSSKARWTVEFINENPNAIRLKSCHGLYLTATNEAFLLGMTGKKVQQLSSQTKPDHTTEWEPIKESAFHVKFRSSDGKFLRANGGTPPWRNSVTHDVPHRTVTQDWVLWGVDVVDIVVSDDTESVMSSYSSFSSVVDGFSGSPERMGSPTMATLSPDTGSRTPSTVVEARETKLSSGMDFFKNAKSVRLRSHHDKYLLATNDQENVLQDRNATTKQANWTVELVHGFNNVVRLKSIYGKYLTASEDQQMMSVNGRKVVQSLPNKLNSSLDWEPIRDGFQIRLKTRYGHYLRANSGLPPWRNSVTHDIPSRHHDWILWDVETVEARKEEPLPPPPETITPDLSSSSFCLRTPKSGPKEVDDLWECGSAKNEGKMVYYKVADDDGNVDDDAYEEVSFVFKGNGLEDLTRDLEEETGLDEIIVCSRNPLNGKLFPLRLALPPNQKVIRVVVVPSTLKVARDF